MRVRAPIIINGFARGGTNILLNIMASHPDVTLLNGETHEIFYGKGNDKIHNKLFKRILYVPIQLACGKYIFKHTDLNDRNSMPKFIRNYFDFILDYNRIKDISSNPNLQRNEKRARNNRLLCKNMNGLVLTTNIFEEIYPDAVFIGLVRHGLALCEGFLRRGWNTKDIGILYEKVCARMIRDAEEKDNYYLIRFEDLISSPQEMINNLYRFAGLDIVQAMKFRLQAKPSMKQNGTREQTFGEYFKEMQWIELENLSSKFRPDVNENQIAQLKDKDKKEFLKYTENTMNQLGYTDQIREQKSR